MKIENDANKYIQALRAFRWAEIIVDALLFESCLGGVAVAMTVASIFYFEFLFLWSVMLFFFSCLLQAFVGPEGVPWTALRVIWGSFV